MPYTTQDDSASVTIAPPCALMCAAPSRPSLPIPVMTTPSTRPPYSARPPTRTARPPTGGAACRAGARSRCARTLAAPVAPKVRCARPGARSTRARAAPRSPSRASADVERRDLVQAAARTSRCSRRACAAPSRPGPGNRRGSAGDQRPQRLRPAGGDADDDQIGRERRPGTSAAPAATRRAAPSRAPQTRDMRHAGGGRRPWRSARRRSRRPGRWRARWASARSPRPRPRARPAPARPTRARCCTPRRGRGGAPSARCRNSTPSIPGIIRSSVTTSGLRRLDHLERLFAVARRCRRPRWRAAGEHLAHDLAHERRSRRRPGPGSAAAWSLSRS